MESTRERRQERKREGEATGMKKGGKEERRTEGRGRKKKCFQQVLVIVFSLLGIAKYIIYMSRILFEN